MARYRTYKNGITGHKYKGLYIIKGETKGKYSILNTDKSIFRDNIYDYDECEWIIDINSADEEELNMIRHLYEKEIFQLSELFVNLMQKKEREGLDEKEAALYKWVEKIRKRKIEEREF